MSVASAFGLPPSAHIMPKGKLTSTPILWDMIQNLPRATFKRSVCFIIKKNFRAGEMALLE
jgi:hypothetical protein